MALTTAMAMFRRRIFYLSGFDPRGARFYRQLHRDAMAGHAALRGAAIEVSARSRGTGMSVDWWVKDATAAAEARCSFLRWDDLVARAWGKKWLALARSMIVSAAGFLRHLEWRAAWHLGRGPCITLVYPYLAVLLLPLLAGLPLAALLALVPGVPVWLALAAGLGAGLLLARKPIDAMRAMWLIRLYIQSDRTARHGLDDRLAERLDEFAGLISHALDDGDDEVLLIAHSYGTAMAVPLMLRLIAHRGGALPEHFVLVTLGHCVGLLGCRRDATQFHAMQRELAGHAFEWVDIGSPPDGAAFSLVNPLAPAAEAGAIRLTLLSPRFHRFYNPETYHKGLAAKYDIHFDYLRCGDRVSPIDYPSLTIGARRLADAIAAFRQLA